MKMKQSVKLGFVLLSTFFLVTGKFDALQFLAGIILTVGYLPQIKDILTTKCVKGLSLDTFASLTFGIFLMEIYAINLVVSGAGFMFLVTNSMALLSVGSVTALIIKYSEEKIFNTNKVLGIVGFSKKQK